MSDAGQLPPRPLPPRRPADAVAAWLAWFGIARLVVTIVAIVAVVAGGYLLVRSPVPPAEADLPVASAATVPAATLPPPTTVAGAARSSRVVVHVAGAVASPGVYELDATARVNAAIERAGGTTVDADPDLLNLAAPVVDGQRIYVPVVGEQVPAEVLPPAPSGAAAEAAERAGPLDLNTATAPALDDLPGIGPATASAIVDDRARNGPFATVDDLERVPGIGPAKLAAIRDLVAV